MKTDTQLRTAVLAVSDSLTSIAVRLKNKTTEDWCATFICTKELASKLKEDDLVVVDTRYGKRVGSVIEVHEESEFYDANIEWRWVIQRVDTTETEHLEAKVQENVAKLKKAQRRHMKRQLVEQLGVPDIDTKLIEVVLEDDCGQETTE